MTRRLNLSFLLTITALSVVVVDSLKINNGVKETPTIKCIDDMIVITVSTDEPHTNGRIYVKDKLGNPECVKPPRRSNFPVEYAFSITSCGGPNSRSRHGTTFEQSLTVVVSFHNEFITKVDRVYHLRCVHKPFQGTVSNAITINTLSTAGVVTGGQDVTYQCNYEILDHRNGNIGGIKNFATVGDKLLHKWTCTPLTSRVCMRVHSCYIRNANAKPFKAIDQNGCSLDKYVMGPLNYTEVENAQRGMYMASAEVHGFKFPESTILNFHCQISVREENCRSLPSDRKNVYTIPGCISNRNIRALSAQASRKTPTLPRPQPLVANNHQSRNNTKTVETRAFKDDLDQDQDIAVTREISIFQVDTDDNEREKLIKETVRRLNELTQDENQLQRSDFAFDLDSDDDTESGVQFLEENPNQLRLGKRKKRNNYCVSPLLVGFFALLCGILAMVAITSLTILIVKLHREKLLKVSH